jgi:Flp pilus assembly protein TadD
MKGHDPAASRRPYEVALEHHRPGQLQAAEAIYQAILAIEPRHADARQKLGVLALQLDRHGVAQRLIQQAIALFRVPTVRKPAFDFRHEIA